MRKFFGILLVLMLIASICSAWPNNPETMAVLKSNPQNYIYYGYTGPGGSLYLDKLSIGVERYEPPYYVIKFKSISYDVFTSNKYANERWKKYHYNYDTKEMFYEESDVNGKIKLEPIDEKKYPKLPANQTNILDGGEIAFYLAYKISFYEKPVSMWLQEYLKTGKWIHFKE